MEFWVVFIIIVLAICVVGLLLRLLSLRASLGEIARELKDKLNTDTNTLISISSGDRAMRALAAEINRQLRSLRKERLELQHGDTELKNAVTNISHDLRTPLTAMCGYLELMKHEPMSENAERYLSVICERTDAMRTLTQELFEYSVITSTADSPNPEQVCINEVLEQSLIGFYGAFSESGIVPKINITDRKVIRNLDRSALRRVFDNIIGNAVKYSDGDLTVSMDGGKIVFSNTASSLGRVQAERLFDRFYTVESARSSSGLGLSIAKLLTEKMGGNIRAEYRDKTLSIILEFN